MITIDTIADVRTGDKGDTLILAVPPRDNNAVIHLRQYLYCDAVTRNFDVPEDSVTHRDVDTLQAMVFQLSSTLGGGVTGSPSWTGTAKH